MGTDFWAKCTKHARVISGDINPYLYGGIIAADGMFIVIPDTEQENDSDKVDVSRIQIRDVTKRYFDWVDLTDLARFAGVDKYDTRTLYGRATFLSDIIAYYGAIEVDQYPETYTVAGLREQFRVDD